MEASTSAVLAQNESIDIATYMLGRSRHMTSTKLDYHILISSKEGERLINNLISDEILRLSNPDSQNKIVVKSNASQDSYYLQI